MCSGHVAELFRDIYIFVATCDLHAELLGVLVKALQPLEDRVVVVAVLAELVPLVVVFVEAEAETSAIDANRTPLLLRALDAQHSALLQGVLRDRGKLTAL